MARRKRRTVNREIELARLEGKTARSMTRWDKAPWVVVSTALALVAWFVAGETTAIDLNVVANASLTLAVPAGTIKILLDRQKKIKQRKRISELEAENTELRTQRARLEGQLEERNRLDPPGGRGGT